MYHRLTIFPRTLSVSQRCITKRPVKECHPSSGTPFPLSTPGLLHFPILCSDNPNYGLPALTSLTAASEASGSAEDDTRLYTCWPGATGGLYYLTGVCGN